MCFKDRSTISSKADAAHATHYEVVDERCISLPFFLLKHQTIFGNQRKLKGLQAYVEYTCQRRYASSESLHEFNALQFYRHPDMPSRIREFECIIGYALQTLPYFQLRYFFAFLLRWVTFEDLRRNAPLPAETHADQHYTEMSIQWHDGRISKEYLPSWIAPSSVVLFFAKRLGLETCCNVLLMDSEGFQNAYQITCELKSWLRFYKTNRYCVYFHLIHIESKSFR